MDDTLFENIRKCMTEDKPNWIELAREDNGEIALFAIGSPGMTVLPVKHPDSHRVFAKVETEGKTADQVIEEVRKILEGQQ